MLMLFRGRRDGGTKMAANEVKPEWSSRGMGWGGSKEWYGLNHGVNVFIQNVVGEGHPWGGVRRQEIRSCCYGGRWSQEKHRSRRVGKTIYNHVGGTLSINQYFYYLPM